MMRRRGDSTKVTALHQHVIPPLTTLLGVASDSGFHSEDGVASLRPRDTSTDDSLEWSLVLVWILRTQSKCNFADS